MNIGLKIRQLRQAKGWKIIELATRVDSDVGNISRLERGKQGYSDDLLRRIAGELGVPMADLFTDEEPNISAGPDIRGKLQLISWVAAGSFCEAIDNLSPGDAEDWLGSPYPAGPNAFLLRVDGPSMYNPDGTGYSHGEIIQVEPERAVTNGSDVVVRTPSPGNGATFKRYHDGPDGPYLEALNPDWPERIVKVPLGTVICGVVVASWRDRRK